MIVKEVTGMEWGAAERAGRIGYFTFCLCFDCCAQFELDLERDTKRAAVAWALPRHQQPSPKRMACSFFGRWNSGTEKGAKLGEKSQCPERQSLRPKTIVLQVI